MTRIHAIIRAPGYFLRLGKLVLKAGLVWHVIPDSSLNDTEMRKRWEEQVQRTPLWPELDALRHERQYLGAALFRSRAKR